MRLDLSALVILSSLSAACGGGSSDPVAPTQTTSAPHASGGRASGGENQQGAAVVATATTSGPPGSATGPTQADVLGRSGYGGEGYGAGPGAGGGITGLIGGDREHPVPTCGAMESYLYVARDFQCPGGGNPLGGDPSAGSGARRGTVGPHAHGAERDPMLDAHIVDVYEVPCPRGPVEVYVCLYHCHAGRTPMD